MKKIIFFISMIFFYAASTYAQSEDWRGGYEELLDEQDEVTVKREFWRTSDCNNFNLIQAGYRSDTGANGFFVGYKHGWNITGEKLPLYIEPGLEFNYYTYYSLTGVGLTMPINFSYKFKIGDFCISPITGPTLGWTHERQEWYYYTSSTYDDFVFGWDFGARIAYKKITLEYRYNKVINDCATWNSHSLGIGFTF